MWALICQPTGRWVMSAEELIAFAKNLDRCWIERRYQELDNYLAPDVTFVAPGGQARTEGLADAVESYREFMSRAVLRRYKTSDYVVTERGDTAVVEYAWEIAWESAGESFAEEGRDVLVLARRNGGWRAVWRTQLPNVA